MAVGGGGGGPSARIGKNLSAIRATVDSSGPGAAAADARFAMGADDTTYLSMSVCPIYAGEPTNGLGRDSDLALTPDGMLPVEAKLATATGLVTAFDRLLQDRRKRATDSLDASTRTLAWLLDVGAVRAAVLEAAEVRGAIDGGFRTELERLYTGSYDEGYSAVLALKGGATTDGAAAARLKGLFEALYSLLDLDGTPVRAVVALLQRDVRDVASNLSGSLERLTHAFLLMGRDPDSWCNEARFGKGRLCTTDDKPGLRGVVRKALEARNAKKQRTEETAAPSSSPPPGSGSGSDSDADYESANEISLCDPLGDAVTASEMGEALHVAFRRVRGDVGNFKDLRAGWSIGNVVSPLLDAHGSDWWLQPNGAFFSEEWRIPDKRVNPATVRKLLDGNVGRDVALGRVVADELHDEGDVYVNYAIARGICGALGPHERPVVGDQLSYDYPRGPLLVDATALREDTTIEARRSRRFRVQRKALRVDAARLYDDRLVDGMVELARGNDIARASLGVASGTGAVGPVMVDNQEQAAACRWAPVHTTESGGEAPPVTSVLRTTPCVAWCRAAVLEHAIAFLAAMANDPKLDERYDGQARTLRAMAAATKLMQLESLAVVANRTAPRASGSFGRVASSATDAELPSLVDDPLRRVLVTRPPVHCGDGTAGDPFEMLFPADAGLVAFVSVSASARSEDGPQVNADFTTGTDTGRPPFDNATQSSVGCGGKVFGNTKLTAWLRDSVGGADRGRVTGDHTTGLRTVEPVVTAAAAEPEQLGLFLGAAPAAHPYRAAGTRKLRNFGQARTAPAELLKPDRLRRAARAGLLALRELDAVASEGKLVDKMRSDQPADGVFKVQTSEALSRERRNGLWEEALREISVSQDRLMQFVQSLSGGLVESASDLLVGEDPDISRTSRAVRERRAAVATRSMAFRARLVESVLDSVFKSSRLALDMERGSAPDEVSRLVITSGKAAEAIKELATGQSGRPFFESNVAMQRLRDGAPGELTLPQIMEQLDTVSGAFHTHLLSESGDDAFGTRLSAETLSQPRNCYFVMLKPEVTEAIREAYLMLTVQLRDHNQHTFRRVWLWEYVEGSSFELRTEFSKLVRYSLQANRFKSTSVAGYVSASAVAQMHAHIRLQLHRCERAVCNYTTSSNAPNFANPNGRLAYYGGRPVPRPALPSPDAPPPHRSDDSDDDDDGPLDKFRVDPDLLRGMLSEISQARAARRRTFANGKLDGGPAGTEPARPINATPVTHIQAGAFMGRAFAFLRSLALPDIESMFHWIMGKLGSQSSAKAYSGLRRAPNDACAKYFRWTKQPYRDIVFNLCEQLGGFNLFAMDNNHATVSRPGVNTRLENVKRYEDYNKRGAHYYVRFDPSKLPKLPGSTGARSNEDISRALNELFDLPDPSRHNNVEDLEWFPVASDGNTRSGWLRKVNEGLDEKQRNAATNFKRFHTWINSCFKGATGRRVAVFSAALLSAGLLSMGGIQVYRQWAESGDLTGAFARVGQLWFDHSFKIVTDGTKWGLEWGRKGAKVAVDSWAALYEWILKKCSVRLHKLGLIIDYEEVAKEPMPELLKQWQEAITKRLRVAQAAGGETWNKTIPNWPEGWSFSKLYKQAEKTGQNATDALDTVLTSVITPLVDTATKEAVGKSAAYPAVAPLEAFKTIAPIFFASARKMAAGTDAAPFVDIAQCVVDAGPDATNSFMNATRAIGAADTDAAGAGTSGSITKALQTLFTSANKVPIEAGVVGFPTYNVMQ